MQTISVRKARSGRGLLGVLIIVLIVVLGGAIIVPLILSWPVNSPIRTPRANMQTIASAEEVYKVKHGKYTRWLADLKDEIGIDFSNKQNPAGPGQRTYCVLFGGACAPNQSDWKTIPKDSFAVVSESTDPEDKAEEDGCYIPGVSH